MYKDMSFNVLALHDSGADCSQIHPDLAARLGCPLTKGRGHIEFASASSPKQERTICGEPVVVFCKTFSAIKQFDVLAMNPTLCPHFLLARDLHGVFDLHIANLPVSFPSFDIHDLDEGWIDHTVRKERLTDVQELTPQEVAEREQLRAEVNSRLQDHASKVDIKSFISHPEATVQILHDDGAPDPKPMRYKSKSYLDQYVADQIALWLTNGKIALWDITKHGAYPRHVMPLLPVVTRKPSGEIAKVRVCVDARALNVNLVDDPTPLPHIHGLYESIRDHKFFGEADAVSCFNQFAINEDHQHKVAIRWDDQVYVWVGAPFGLRHISSHAQRVFQTIFADMPFVRVFVDNFVIASHSLQDHRQQWTLFIDRCTAYNIKLDPLKAKIAMTAMVTLGNMLLPTGIAPCPEKVKTALAWATPTSRKELSTFLGYANFLRYYSMLAAPLELLRAQLAPKLPSSDVTKESRRLARLSACREQNLPYAGGPFTWTEEADQAFQIVKHAIARAPALHFPDYTKRFGLAVDASQYGVGCVLFQAVTDDAVPTVDNVISFSSRSLVDYERRYAPYMSELAGIIYGLRTYEDFLGGREFLLLTDHRALTFMFTSPELNRTITGWYSVICQFDFRIRHTPGILNVLPDALSRMRMQPGPWGLAPSNADADADASVLALNTVQRRAARVSAKLTWADAHGQELAVDATTLPRRVPASSAAAIVARPVPADSPLAIVRRYHEQSGHFGERTVLAHLKRDGVKIAGAVALTHEVCQSCSACLAHNTSKRVFHPLRPVTAPQPWSMLQLDLYTAFESVPSPSGAKYIMVLVDVFTSFCILRALPNKEASTIARVLWSVFSDFGPPISLQSDNAKEFVAAGVAQLLKDFDVKFQTSAPYMHRQNGKAESHVGVAGLTLKKLLHASPLIKDWADLVPAVQLLINSRHKHLTNCAPFPLMFNRVANQWQSYAAIDIDEIKQSDYADWLEREQRLHEMVFPVIRSRISQFQNQYVSNFHPLATTSRRLPTGAVVMLYDVLRASKRDPRFIGPFTVTRCTPGGLYSLRDFFGKPWPRDVTRDCLKVVDSMDMAKAAQQSNTQFVDRIQDDRLGANGTEYLVKMSGFVDLEWVSEDAIADKTLLRGYQLDKAHKARAIAAANKPVFNPTAHVVVKKSSDTKPSNTSIVPVTAAAQAAPADPTEPPAPVKAQELPVPSPSATAAQAAPAPPSTVAKSRQRRANSTFRDFQLFLLRML